MSFNVGSGSGTLSFRPARFNVDWDGVSQAKATFALTCWDPAASYSAIAYQVWDRDGELGCSSGGIQVSPIEYERGERYWTFNGSCQRVFASDTSLSMSAANGTAQVTFSSLSTTAQHAWQLRATKSGVTRVLIAGLVRTVELNPYEPGGGSVNAVSGVTASGCF